MSPPTDRDAFLAVPHRMDDPSLPGEVTVTRLTARSLDDLYLARPRFGDQVHKNYQFRG
jgi:hypothetical protein